MSVNWQQSEICIVINDSLVVLETAVLVSRPKSCDLGALVSAVFETDQ